MEHTEELCIVELWLKYLGFCFVFIPLAAKTYRIYAIFTNKTGKSIKISDSRMLAMFSVAVALFSIFLIVWSTLDRPEVLTGILSSNEKIYSICSSPKTTIVGLVVVFVCMAWGLFLSIQTRNVPEKYNEAKSLGAMVYLWAFLRVFVEIIAIVRLDPDIYFVIISCEVLITNLGVLALVIAPKLVAFWGIFGKTNNDGVVTETA
ncbi:hypothetical protein HK098_002725 [Nowakowskiella sp. JEL0407]|nr:hypothetical protein HK098_002725 [Nowakowskiella sp. JEL0407]